MLQLVFACIFRKRYFDSKRIILFTDAGAPFTSDRLDDIITGLEKYKVELDVM